MLILNQVVLVKQCIKLFEAERFPCIAINTRFNTFCLVGICRYGNDSCMANYVFLFFQSAYFFYCLKTIHFRHLDVHQYQVVLFIVEFLKGFGTVMGNINIVPASM